MRKWIISLAVLLIVPALSAAAPIVQPAEDEQLVEGHTVFTLIEQYTDIVIAEQVYGAAAAVLVREANCQINDFYFPGVLWFNDQYLVNPDAYYDDDCDYRYPCTGAVLATEDGTPDIIAGGAFAGGVPSASTVYHESYLITDPNDFTWNIDKWNWTSGGTPYGVWSVPIMGNDAGYSTPDDGSSNCAPVDESEMSVPICPLGNGRMGLDPLRCQDEDYITNNSAAARYNALLFFNLAHFSAASQGTPKDHNVPSGDVAGCHDSVSTQTWNKVWPCPNGDDDAEGNSHPYNPFANSPVCPNCAGQGVHGQQSNQNVHVTHNIDVYYDVASLPTRVFAIEDYEGSTAPFHCHDGQICIDPDFSALY